MTRQSRRALVTGATRGIGAATARRLRADGLDVVTLAGEQARHGITANAVVPGGIATEVMMAVPDEIRAGIVAGIPAGRLGTPDEVAHLVSFLASEMAGYVTGESIGIDGALGMTGVSQMDS